MEFMKEYIAFLIPLAVLQLSLQIAAIVSILRKKRFKTGNMAIWLIVSILVNTLGIGPILYFIFGRAED